MRKLISIYKRLGETPLQTIDRLRREAPHIAEEKITFLGRLDPMAEGLLLLLVGDTRNKEKYLVLDKVYEFEILWGFQTDTYDILGKVIKSGVVSPEQITHESRINTSISKFLGKHRQKYPPYSSKYWQKARAGEEIKISEREITIHSFKHLGDRTITRTSLLADILTKINKVQGDFRQTEIIERWKEVLIPSSDSSAAGNDSDFLISKFKARVSSGTYIRSLAQEMGGLAYSIKRTSVGEFSL